MRAGIDGATLALYTSGVFDLHSRLRIENGNGTKINLQGHYHHYSWRMPNPNQPIASLDVDFIRETTKGGAAQSLAPTVVASRFNRLDDGVTYSPLLQLGRIVTLDIALTAVGGARPADGSALWYEVFRGYIRNVDWPEVDSRKASIACNDIAGILQIAKTESAHIYDAGTSLETVARQILDNNGFNTWAINFPVPTGKVIPVDYSPGYQKPIWSMLWDLALSFGGIVYLRYLSSNNPTLTFFQPARGKVVADMTIDAYDYKALSVDEEEVRNVGYMLFFDQNNTQQLIGPQVNNASIIKYGGSMAIRRPFWIKLEADSPIRSTSEATDMLTAALSDVSDPDMIGNVLTYPMVFAEPGVDLYEFLAREEVFDTNQTLAPFGVDTEVSADRDPVSVIGVRGVPTAGAKSWRLLTGSFPVLADPPEILHSSIMPRYAGGQLVGWQVYLTVNERTQSLRAVLTGGVTLASGQSAVVDTSVDKSIVYLFDQAAGGDGEINIYPHADTAGLAQAGEPFAYVASRPPLTTHVTQRISRTEHLITLRAEPASATTKYRYYQVGDTPPAYVDYTGPFIVHVQDAEDTILQFYSQITGVINALVVEEVHTVVLDNDHKPEVLITSISEYAANELAVHVSIDDDCARWQLFARLGASPIDASSGIPDLVYMRGEFSTSVSSFLMSAATGTWYIAVRGLDFNSFAGDLHELQKVVAGAPAAGAELSNVVVNAVSLGGGSYQNRVSWNHTTVVNTDGRYRVHVYESVDSAPYVQLTPGAADVPTREARTDHDGTNGDTVKGSFNATTYASCPKTVPPTPGCNYVTWFYRVELWDNTAGTKLAEYFTQRSAYASAVL